MYFFDLILYFAAYSFLGWLMETIYASMIEKKFINRGFLFGPFCPIYGFGAILTIFCFGFTSGIFENVITVYLFGILILIVLASALEYITGFALEKIFNCKWWDYSENAFNLHGYICLKYSLLWGGLAFLMIQVVHPEIVKLFFFIPLKVKMYFSIILILYFFVDTIKSILAMVDLRKVILKYSNFPVNKYMEKIIKYQRVFLAFPRLLLLNAGIGERDIRGVLNGRINKIKVKIKNRHN